MDYQRGVTCQITAFRIDDPPADPFGNRLEWLAIATAQVFDPTSDGGGKFSQDEAVLGGVVTQTIHGRGTAKTEHGAMAAALEGLLFQLKARGFSQTFLPTSG